MRCEGGCDSFDGGAFAGSGISVKKHVAGTFTASQGLCVFQDEISFPFIAKELVEGLMIRVCYRYDFSVVQAEKVIFGEDAVAGFGDVF